MTLVQLLRWAADGDEAPSSEVTAALRSRAGRLEAALAAAKARATSGASSDEEDSANFARFAALDKVTAPDEQSKEPR